MLGRCLPSRASDRENECSVSDRAMQRSARALTSADRPLAYDLWRPFACLFHR